VGLSTDGRYGSNHLSNGPAGVSNVDKPITTRHRTKLYSTATSLVIREKK